MIPYNKLKVNKEFSRRSMLQYYFSILTATILQVIDFVMTFPHFFTCTCGGKVSGRCMWECKIQCPISYKPFLVKIIKGVIFPHYFFVIFTLNDTKIIKSSVKISHIFFYPAPFIVIFAQTKNGTKISFSSNYQSI